MDGNLVVEIEDLQRSEFGSGYLFAPCRILTARHVIAAERGRPGREGGYQVRLRFDQEWWRARHLWSSRELDLAVLEPVARADDAAAPLEGSAWARAPQARLGRILEGPEIPCRGIGFPDVQQSVSGSGTYQLKGDVYPGTSTREGELFIQVESPRPLDRERGWPGMSGSAVFRDELLLGVVTDTSRVYQDHVLLGTRITRALELPAFLRAAYNGAAVPPEDVRGVEIRSAPSDLTSLSRLLHFIDCESQIADLAPAIAAIRRDWWRPLVVVLNGLPEDELLTAIERFCDDPLPKQLPPRHATPGLADAGEPREVFKNLDWPAQLHDPDETLRNSKRLLLSWQLWDDAPEDPDPATIRAALNRRLGPRVFVSFIRASRFDQSYRRLVDLWLEFWSEVAAEPLNDIVTVFLCCEHDPLPRDPSLWQRIFARPPARIDLRQFTASALVKSDEPVLRRILPDLIAYSRKHMEDWLTAHVLPRHPELRPHAARIQQKLGLSFLNAQELRCAELRRALAELRLS